MKQGDRHQKNAYLHELAEQVEEQKRRRAKEQADASTDWWEKKKPPVEAEYKSPHPNQVRTQTQTDDHQMGLLFVNLKLPHINRFEGNVP